MDEKASTIARTLLAHESMVVIGRPGTGKTALLEDSYAQITAATSPATVLVLTPNRDHANELRDRLKLPDEAVLNAAPARSISSFAYGITRAAHVMRTGEDLEFLSGADQDVHIAEILAGHELGRGRLPRWPEEITDEVRATSAFRTEVRDALNRVMEFDFGLRIPKPDAGDFVFDFGRSAMARIIDRDPDPRWVALSQVLDEYLEIMSMPGYGGIDSATVLAKAAFEVLREPAEVTAGRPWSFAPDRVPEIILVDAAQDLPAASCGLLDQLMTRGCTIGLFGSPETVTGRFHGADASVIDRAAGDSRLTRFVLDSPPTIEDSLRRINDDFGRRITRRWGLGHIPRPPEVVEQDAEVSALEAHVFDGAAVQYRYLAKAVTDFVESGRSWSEVAVIARNTSSARMIAQELGASRVATVQLTQPLSIDPATQPLLQLLAGVPDFADDEAITATALDLASSIFIRLDAIELRRFRRLVRQHFPAANSTASLAQALRSTESHPEIPGLDTITRMLRAGEEQRSADPHQALWAIWEAAGVAHNWQLEALGDPESMANSWLDSVLRLFTLAEKFSARGGFTATSFSSIVSEQDIAQDSLAARAGFDDFVSVGTPASLAHRRFPFVIIADVNEGVWPNPKLRGSILGLADLASILDEGSRVTADPGYHSYAKTSNLREEGELFYTALTRADERLLITSISNEDTNPSPFFDAVATHVGSGSETGHAITNEDDLLPLSPSEIAARGRAQLLRAAGRAEPGVNDIAGEEPLSSWAELVKELGRIEEFVVVPDLWREAESLSSTEPLYGDEAIVKVSPSQVETFTNCSLRWFLTRNGGDRPMGIAQNLGTILHAAAESHPTGPTSALRQFVEEEFASIDYSAQWERKRDHDLAMSMVDRLGDYILNAPGEVLGVEAQVYATGTDDSGRTWKVTGRLDRIESVPGGIRIVDFKTGKNVETGEDMPRNAQLGVYQEAVDVGTITLPDGTIIDAKSYGAELVYLRKSSRTVREQKALENDAEPRWAGELINEVSAKMRSSAFPATVDPAVCRSCPVRSSCPAVGPQLMEAAE